VCMPYAPLNVLKPVVAGAVWIVDGPEIEFNWLGLSLPFPTRMALIRLPGGDVWVHSPTAPDAALLAAVRALGPVRWLVAPNTLHYWWVPDWKAAFPAAEVLAAPGLERSAKRPLPIDTVVGDAAPAAWSGEIDQLVVRGDLLTEACFFHRPTRTLLLTDLIENFEPRRVRRWWFRALLRLGGAADPDGKAPIDMRLSFLRHRRALRASVLRMLAWNPERVIIAHGRWYERDGATELRRAFRWVL
jgi:Domain of unknown function (DUF4336)